MEIKIKENSRHELCYSLDILKDRYNKNSKKKNSQFMTINNSVKLLHKE